MEVINKARDISYVPFIEKLDQLQKPIKYLPDFFDIPARLKVLFQLKMHCNMLHTIR
jgi:hypothetical protein